MGSHPAHTQPLLAEPCIFFFDALARRVVGRPSWFDSGSLLFCANALSHSQLGRSVSSQMSINDNS
jgi:hypothetical protein